MHCGSCCLLQILLTETSMASLVSATGTVLKAPHVDVSVPFSWTLIVAA